MGSSKIRLDSINMNEALRYLGYRTSPDEVSARLLEKCKADLLRVIDARYTFRVFPLEEGQIPGSLFRLEGKSIAKHLKGCTQVILLCATLSDKVDRLIRIRQLSGMAEAMMLDALASAAVEQVCDLAEREILLSFPGMQRTWRYGLGYGDFPLSGQEAFLNILDAPKRIGVCVTPGQMLTPSKSVTSVIGLGTDISASARKTCGICSMSQSCPYRIVGSCT